MAARTLLPTIRRARAGSAADQLALGRHYLAGGKGVARNPAAAAMWLLRAAAAGNQEAAVLLAEEVPADLCADAAAFEQACRTAAAAGSQRAAYVLTALREAQGAAGLDDFLAAARAGEPRAARRAGELLLERGERAQAIDWLTSAAEANDAAAIARLAALLSDAGDPRAERWLEPAAQAGDAQAQFQLAELLLADADPARQAAGLARLREAAHRGHARALWRLGRGYVHGIDGGGHGQANALGRAIAPLERAAAAGVVDAWWDLARIYDWPRFAGRDPRRARECLERAARENVAAAQLALGERLAARSRDLSAWLTAGRWLALAQDNGEPTALATLAAISDAAPAPPDADEQVRVAALSAIAKAQPALAARLRLAAQFGLSEREALFLDVARTDQGWCLLADVSEHFRYKPWRLVRIERPSQREALLAALAAFRDPAVRSGDLVGAMRPRARRLASLLAKLGIARELFFSTAAPAAA